MEVFEISFWKFATKGCSETQRLDLSNDIPICFSITNDYVIENCVILHLKDLIVAFLEHHG